MWSPGTPVRVGLGLALALSWAFSVRTVGRRLASYSADRGASPTSLSVWLHGYGFILASVFLCAALGVLNVLALTIVQAGAAIMCATEESGANPLRNWWSEMAARHRLMLLAILALALPSVINAVWGVLLPPYFHDDFSYHLVFPVEWMQQESLTMRAVPFGNHSPTYYPMNTEAFYLWLLLPFGQLFHLNGAQSLFLPATVWASVALFRRTGASRGAASLAAMLFCIGPVVVSEQTLASVDIAFGCFFLVSLEAILAFRDDPKLARFLAAALACGLFIGTKMPGCLFGVFLLGPVMAAALRGARRDVAFVRTAQVVGGALLGVAVLMISGGWWYVRNLLVTGNPVFPLHAKIAGVQLWQGAYDRHALPASSVETLAELYLPALAALYALAAVVTLAMMVTGRAEQRRDAGRAAALGLLLPGVIAVLFHFLMPFNYARFVLGGFALTAAPVAMAFSARSRMIRVGMGLALVAALGFCVWTGEGRALILPLQWRPIAKDPAMWNALLTGLAAVPLVVAALATRRWWRGLLGVAACGLVLSTLQAATRSGDPDCAVLSEAFSADREAFFYLDSRADADEELHVAFAGTNLTLLLHGRNLSHEVRYINVTGEADWLFHDHVREFTGDREAQQGSRHGVAYYRDGRDFETWWRNLSAWPADLLVVERLARYARKSYDLVNGFPIEARWAAQHPERFTEVYASPEVLVYEVIR